MSWEGYKAVPIEKSCSLVTAWPQERLPSGCSPDNRNVRFTAVSCATRFGLNMAINAGTASPVTGLAALVRDGNATPYLPMIFTADGKLQVESPLGTGTTVGVTLSDLVQALPSASYMESAAAFQRIYVTFSDLIHPTGAPLVYDGSILVPWSMRPLGEAWQASTIYAVGEVISPTLRNQHIYRCVVGGTSGAVEPAWNTGASSLTVSGGATFKEANIVANAAGTGHVDAGTRYGVVFYVNTNGYISGATSASVFATVMAGNTSLQLDNLPIGPSNTVQRIIALGIVGGSSGGPFNFVPKTDNFDGISISSFVVDDNTTTLVVLDFNDTYLQTATDATNNLRKVKLKNQTHNSYIPSQRRMFCFGEESSLVRCSEPDDPETFYGDTGYFYVNRDDGQRAITAVEFKGEIYLFKERNTFIVNASETDPSSWTVTTRYSKLGAAGPRAVDVGKDFIVVAHRSGAFIIDGSPTPKWITQEIADLWAKINWNYAYKVVVNIDEELKEIRISVPFGEATENCITLTCNYARGYDDPVYFSSFLGRDASSDYARKWSVDDIAATEIVRIERPLTPIGGQVIDSLTRQSQLLFASPNEDGIVNALAIGTYSDNGQGINSYMEMSSVGLGNSLVRFGGIVLSMTGNGKCTLDLTHYHGDPIPLKGFDLLPDEERFYKRQGKHTSRQFGYRVSNASVAGSWWEVFEAILYLDAQWDSES